MALSSNMYALIVQRLEKILAKFFKVRPENSPHLKGQTALWPKWNYPLISLQVKVQRLEKIVAQEKAPKVPERPRYGNFSKVTQNLRFLKKCKGETKENFLKMGKKVALA